MKNTKNAKIILLKLKKVKGEAEMLEYFSYVGTSSRLRIEDFLSSMESDADLIHLLGFDDRYKKRGELKTKGESDYLGCYRWYLKKQIDICKQNRLFSHLIKLQKASELLDYVMNKRRSSFIGLDQSSILAKCKIAIRSIIVGYNVDRICGKVAIPA